MDLPCLPRARARVPAVVLVGSALLLPAACSSDQPPPGGITAAQRRADVEVKSSLKNSATVMESSFIDLEHYPYEAGDLFTDDLAPGDGVSLEAFTTLPDGRAYCLRAFSAEGTRTGPEGDGDYWWYASDDLRIRPDPRGWCVSAGEFWVVAG